MAIKTWAQGTKVKRLNPATSVYDEIPSLGDITGPDLTRDWLDLTTHDSPGGFEEGIPTILRTGEVAAPLMFDPTNPVHQALLNDLQTNAKRTWRIVSPTAAADYLQFDGYVLGLGHTFPVTGAMSRNFRLRVSGTISVGTGG
jgi:Lambda phage tail tube protein, TTP